MAATRVAGQFQQAHTSLNGTVLSTSTLPSAITAGNALAIGIAYDTTAGVSDSVADDLSAAATTAGVSTSAGGYSQQIAGYYYKNYGGGARTFTLSTPGSNAGRYIGVVEVQGADKTSPLGGVSSGSGLSAAPSSGNVSPAPTLNGAYIFGLLSNANSSVATPTGSFVAVQSDTTDTFSFEADFAQSTAGAVAATWSMTSGSWEAIAFVLNPAAATGGGWVGGGSRQAPGQRGPFDQRGFLKSPFRQYSFAPAGGALNAYTLTADQGTFTLTGIAANLLKGYTLPAAKGTFIVTGVAANLLEGHRVTAAPGAFVLSGVAAGLFKGSAVTAARGSFVLNGAAANLLEGHLLGASPGTFVLNGVAAALSKGRILSAAPGSVVLAGQDAALLVARQLPAGVGVFTLTGYNVANPGGAAPDVGDGVEEGKQRERRGGLLHELRFLEQLEQAAEHAQHEATLQQPKARRGARSQPIARSVSQVLGPVVEMMVDETDDEEVLMAFVLLNWFDAE